MRLRVLSVGRDKSGLFQPAVETYAGRLQHYLPFELVELKPSRHKEPARARAEEGKRILEAARPGFWALDERGKALTSEQLAEAVGTRMQTGRDLDLVIGGDEGLDPAIRQKAERTLRLSAMTLPHRLAKVVAVEQLYRALTIIRGEPYHK